MAPASPSSMVEGLSAILTSLAPLDAAPDADADFLNNIRSMIASKIRETTASDLQSQADRMLPNPTGPAAMGADLGGNLAPPPMMPMPGGGGMGMSGHGGPPSGAMGAGAPGPGRGISPAPPMPNPDELRRVLNIG